MSPSDQEKIIAFIQSTGLRVEQRVLIDPTFLPGISIDRGTLVYDPALLLYPGDLLHEAGHLAVLPAAERNALRQDAGNDGGMEMAAIAWSYAASVFLQIPPEVVFHPHGYKGGSSSLAENFSSGNYLGVPVLEWRGMTDYQQIPQSQSEGYYPKMKKWLCS